MTSHYYLWLAMIIYGYPPLFIPSKKPLRTTNEYHQQLVIVLYKIESRDTQNFIDCNRVSWSYISLTGF